MSSNENDTEVNNAIMALLRRPPVGRKMKTLPLRLHKDEQPPGYGKADEAGAPPSYDTKGEAPDTKEKPSISEKRSVDEEPSVAEKASMATEEAPVADDRFKKPAGFVLDPLYFSRKRAAAAAKKTGPTEVQVMEAKYQKMMGSLGDMVKTEKEVEQGTKLTDYDIAQRAEAHFIKKNLKLRYFHECSGEHFDEFKKLVSDGMSIDEACAAHSDFRAWMAVETEPERLRSLHTR